MDLRSVALLRIGLAVLLLIDLAVNAGHLRAFYTDEGVLPRSILYNITPYPLGILALHSAGGSVGFEAGLFGVQAALALMMLVGWRTRLVTIGSYALLLSMENRNPMVLYGADMMLRLGLFWAIFLPLGDRWSLDAAGGRIRPSTETVWLGFAGFAFIVQLGLSYSVSALLKTGAAWRVDHTAVAYALALDVYHRPFGSWLRQFGGVTKAMTVGVCWLELYGPLLFVIPWRNGWARMLGIGLFAGLQAGFSLCMQMGFFGAAMIVPSLVLLPPEFWNDYAMPVGRRLAGWCPARQFMPKAWQKDDPARQPCAPAPVVPRHWSWTGHCLCWLRDGGLLALVSFVIWWNLAQIPQLQTRVPVSLNWIAYDVGLDQNYGVFAPDPQIDDGWYVFYGTMKNGRTVNLFTGQSPAVLDRPDDIPGSFGGIRWMSYLIFIWSPAGHNFLEPLAQHIGRKWNLTHSGDEQLASLDIILMSEPTLPDLTKPPPEMLMLWTEFF